MVPLEFLIRKANQKKKQVNSEIVVEQTKTFTRFSFIFALANPIDRLIKRAGGEGVVKTIHGSRSEGQALGNISIEGRIV